MMTEETMVVIMITAFAVMLISICWVINMRQRRIEQLRKYRYIRIGMSEVEVLDIMGNGYSRSLLKNNRVKYEWRINATSYGSSYKGASVRNYSGVRKVGIYLKDGLVEEVKPYNI